VDGTKFLLNSDELWITLNGWNDGEKIYNSTDGGTSWNNISINLPNLPTNIVKYRTTDNSLYLGMDIGVYYFNEVLGSWIPFIDNLPNVIVNDLEINENSGIIRAGTYGRGVWESGLYNSVQVDLDAMLISINKPTGNYCGELTEAEITFRNLGTVDILSLDIVYNVDGGVNTVYNWTGNLAPGENQTLNLDPFNSTNGNHVFNVILENPNGLTDQKLAGYW